MMRNRLILVGVIAALIAAFIVFDLGHYFSLSYLKSQQAAVEEVYRANPLQTVAAFFLIYVAATGLSLPGATILTLAAGAIFGLLWGTVIVSFASSIGATLAFLASRFLFRDAIQAKFGDKLRAINAGIDKDGAFYLFTLRLVPALPFFVINLVDGADLHQDPDLLLGKPGRNARRHHRVRECRHPDCADRIGGRDSFPGADRLVHSARHLPADREENYCHDQGTQGVLALHASAQVRSQRHRHRRRLRWAGFGLHRRRGEGQGDIDREGPHGRRLSQYRLRALEGADSFREVAVACQARAGVRRARGQGDFRVRRRQWSECSG